MSVVQTLLIYVGIPAAVYVVAAVLIFAPGGSGKTPRYRPGKGWVHEPVWYLPRPPAAGDARHAVAALPAGSGIAGRTARGGASGTW